MFRGMQHHQVEFPLFTPARFTARLAVVEIEKVDSLPALTNCTLRFLDEVTLLHLVEHVEPFEHPVGFRINDSLM